MRRLLRSIPDRYRHRDIIRGPFHIYIGYTVIQSDVTIAGRRHTLDWSEWGGWEHTSYAYAC